MDNDFTEVMSKRTDEELVKIVTLHRMDYQPKAIEAAEREIDLRKLDAAKIDKLKDEAASQRKEQEEIDSVIVSSITRLLHFLVDTVVVFLLAIFLSIVPGVFKTQYTIVGVKLIAAILFFTSFMIYYTLMEFKFQKTLGKYLTKTRVVIENGQNPGLKDILIRTICRFIPLDRLSFVFTTNGIHDYLSKTTVIKDKN
jgi:uncharacterized RDD family membrane protein YckC